MTTDNSNAPRLAEASVTCEQLHGMSYDERWRHTKFVVEADGYSELQLWSETHERIGWVQCHGFLHQVGELHGRPVCISVTWNLLDGHLVAFYEATSELVDWKMVRKYIDAKRGAAGHCNAMNFHHCTHALGIGGCHAA